MRTNRKIYLIVSICALSLLGIGLIVNTVWSLSGISLISQLTESSNMEEYLNDKYNQEFVVKEVISRGGSGIGASATVQGSAYLKSNPSIKFDISRESNGSTYYETYLDALWSSEGYNTASHFLESKLGSITEFELRTGPGQELKKSINGNPPSFAQIQQDKSSGYGYNLKVYSSTLGGINEPSDLEIQRVIAVINFVKEQTDGYVSLEYYYCPRDAGRAGVHYDCRIELKGEKLRTATSTDIRDSFWKF